MSPVEFVSLFQDPQVSVQVYYESLCPDSILWMDSQLGPTWEALGQYMTVDYNPFGFATVSEFSVSK